MRHMAGAAKYAAAAHAKMMARIRTHMCIFSRRDFFFMERSRC
jgi:hypothetical protein